MEYVTIEELLNQVNELATDSVKTQLEAYGETAEVMIRNWCHCTSADFKNRSEDGTVPKPIGMAVKLIVGHWWKYREAGSQQPVNMVALGVADLIKPYRHFPKNWRL